MYLAGVHGFVTSYSLLHTHKSPAFDLAYPGWLGHAQLLLGIGGRYSFADKPGQVARTSDISITRCVGLSDMRRLDIDG